ncbi:hypothetical protein ACQQCD_02595 [Pseudarthrobacter sp. J1763]|uniref:hypothetical protein n=1 Tax=Pseudarthrobacter sp. J1763 TaxID=3420445 RepID=UPI003D2B0C5C
MSQPTDDSEKMPDPQTLRSLREHGWRLHDIAQEYGVTESAVWRALEEAAKDNPIETKVHKLPWVVAEQHQKSAMAGLINCFFRILSGQEEDPQNKVDVQEWLKHLRENDLVVNYHPEAPANPASTLGGFYYTPRLPQDVWIFREVPRD